MLSLLDEVEVFQLRSKDDEIERRLGLQLPGVRVDRVEELEWVGGAGDVAQLPVHLALDARDVEEHVALGEVGRRGQGGQTQLVLDVDRRSTLNGHVKHLQDLRISHLNMIGLENESVTFLETFLLRTPRTEKIYKLVFDPFPYLGRVTLMLL